MSLAAVTIPFRMQPGLARVDAALPTLTRLDPGSVVARAKSLASRLGQALHHVPGFDDTALRTTLASHLAQLGIPAGEIAGSPIEGLIEEDLALLELAQRRVPWMCVCLPSGWAPEEKIGGTLESIHAPVADNTLLTAAWPHVARLLGQGGAWERHVWTLSPSAELDQHPGRHPHPGWPMEPDPEALAQRCWFRSERQRFIPVIGPTDEPTRAVLFAIHVRMQPLPDVVRTPAQASLLHAALESMSPAVLAYKRLDPARERLLAWLQLRVQAA